MATKEELNKKVAEIKAKLPEKYREAFQEHCDKSLNLQLTLKKERTNDEWVKFLDKQKKEPIETIYLLDKDRNRKKDEKTGKEMVNLALSYEDIINHKDYKEIESEKRQKEIILLKAISSMANAKAELEVVAEYLKIDIAKINNTCEMMLKGNSSIRSKYSTKVSEMKAQLGMRTRGEKQAKENIELSDLL